MNHFFNIKTCFIERKGAIVMLFLLIVTIINAQKIPKPEFDDSYAYTMFLDCKGKLDNYALLFIPSGIDIQLKNGDEHYGSLRMYIKPGYQEIKARLDQVKGYTTYTTDYSEQLTYFSPGEKYLLSVALGEKTSFFNINKLTAGEKEEIEQNFKAILNSNDGQDYITKYAAAIERITCSRNLDCNPRFSAVNQKLAYYSGGFDRAIILTTPGGNMLEYAIIPETYPLKVAGYFDWMPDGKSLLCVMENEPEKWCIAVIRPVPGKLEYTLVGEQYKTEKVSIDIEHYQPEIVVDVKEWILKWSRPRVSPDGQQVYFDYEQNNTSCIGVKDLSSNSLNTLSEGSCPTVSPDGNMLAYMSNKHLYIRPLKPGQESEGTAIVTEKNYACEKPEWSPDGRYLVFQAQYKDEWRSEELYAVNIESGKMFTLTRGKKVSCYEPEWADDGYIYLRIRQDEGREFSDIWRLKPNLP